MKERTRNMKKRLWPRRTRARLIMLLVLWFAVMLVGRTVFAQDDTDKATDSPADESLDDTAVGTIGGTDVPDITGNVSNNTNNEPCVAPLKYRAINGKSLATCDENNCCLTCPFINNFYKEGVIDRLYKIFGGLGIAGFVLMTFLAISFAILPGMRDNPTTTKLLLPFIISVCIFLFQNFFTVQQQASQCANEFEQATASHVMCGIQAVFTLAGAYSIACWSALLIVHLHLLSVWRSTFVLRHVRFFHVVIWFVTLAAAAIPLSLNKVASGNICFISQSASNLFYVPLSFIYVAFIVHLVTFAYMLNVSLRTNFGHRSNASHRTSMSETHRRISHIRHIFRLQWRALLGCALMLLIYIMDIVFYVFYYEPPPDSLLQTYVTDWIKCLKEGGSQNECSARAKHVVPSVAFVAAFLFVNYCAGILIFIIFAAKRRFVTEWISLMRNRGKPARSRSGSRSTTGRESRADKPHYNPETRSTVTQGELDVTNVPHKPFLSFASYNHDNDGNAMEEASAYLPPPPRITLPGGDRNRNRDKGEGGVGYSIHMNLVETTSPRMGPSSPRVGPSSLQRGPSSPQGSLSPPPSPTNRKTQSSARASSVLMPLTPNLRSSFATETTEMSSSKSSPCVTAPPSPSRPRFDVEDPSQIKVSPPLSPPPIQTNVSMARASFGVLDTPSSTDEPSVSFVNSMPPPPPNRAMLANDDSNNCTLRSSEGDDHERDNKCIDDGEVFGHHVSESGNDNTSERSARVSAFGNDEDWSHKIIDQFLMPVPSQEHPDDTEDAAGVAVDTSATMDKGMPLKDDQDLTAKEKECMARQEVEVGDIEYGIAM